MPVARVAEFTVAYCQLIIANQNAQAVEIVSGVTSQALTVAGQLQEPGVASLRCTNSSVVGDLVIETFNLNAIKVGTLALQP